MRKPAPSFFFWPLFWRCLAYVTLSAVLGFTVACFIYR